MKDVGEAAKLSVGLRELGNCAEKHSERDTHRLLVGKYKLALPIPLRQVICKTGLDPTDSMNFPVLHLRDWCRFLIRSNNFHVLSGLVRPNPVREKAIWESFWARYRAVEPAHPIYKLAAENKLELGNCAATLLHGDEGRGRKRSAFFVLSFRSVLGRGCQVESRGVKPVVKSYLKQKLNFRGSTLTNRYMVGVLPKDMYTSNEGVLNSLLEVGANEAEYMAYTGIPDNRTGERKFMMLLNVIGDWPFLVRSGNLVRNYGTVQKRLNLRSDPTGICHLCQAGKKNVPWDSFSSRNPRWLETELVEPPFRAEPIFSNVPHPPGKLAAFFAFDLFHAFHIGTGKAFLGSCLALLSQYEAGSNIDLRFENLTKRYKTWCGEHKRTSHIKRLTPESLGWESSSVFPNGNWHKGGLTQVLMDFVEDILCNNPADYAHDYQLTKAGQAAKAINEFFRILYGSEAWLSRDVALLCGELVLRFLRRYADIAGHAHRNGQAFWALYPKMHILQHTGISLLNLAKKCSLIPNPLLHSVQCDEDYVGRPSRTSRRVDVRLVVQRVIERHLQRAYADYVACGYLREPK